MNWREASAHLRNGLAVRRRSWGTSRCLRVEKSSGKIIVLWMHGAEDYVPNEMNEHAMDWEIKKRPR